MSAAVIDEREGRQASAASPVRARSHARRTLLAQAGGTLVLRTTNAIVCRALKGSGTTTAFALSNASGM